MKKLILTVFLTTSLLILAEQGMAQDRNFGIGAQVTSPAGITMKGWVSETGALASVFSFNLSENASSFYLHLDYQDHKIYDDLNWEFGYLSYYYGGGVRYIWREIGLDDSFFALRLPAGLNANFTELPVEFYMEIAPTFEVVPDFNFGFAGGFGFRYFLN
ncbi:hypothetical protein [Rhodohalobacter mucosus]|uniref:Secreted protein n=1 Tax=Rhodohalobacter mucosus TaxID=2079485 RepID=A0A316TRH5_9BACT|nr:hypothetical protein [Rhodohalobacter mucosus]PWN07223.1 hypothetical protein DDZ15_05335 [Rhodohalobacter mucosus]